MSLDFTEEQLAGFPPDAQAIIRALLVELKRLTERSRRVGRSKDSAELVAASQHTASACEARWQASVPEPTWRPTGAREIRAGVASDGPMSRRRSTPALRLPPMWNQVVGPRSRTVAASSVGTARDQAVGHRIPTAPSRLSWLRYDDLRGTPAGRADRSVGTTLGGLHRAADGLLPSEQTSHGDVSGRFAEPAVLPGD